MRTLACGVPCVACVWQVINRAASGTDSSAGGCAGCTRVRRYGETPLHAAASTGKVDVSSSCAWVSQVALWWHHHDRRIRDATLCRLCDGCCCMSRSVYDER